MSTQSSDLEDVFITPSPEIPEPLPRKKCKGCKLYLLLKDFVESDEVCSRCHVIGVARNERVMFRETANAIVDASCTKQSMDRISEMLGKFQHAYGSSNDLMEDLSSMMKDAVLESKQSGPRKWVVDSIFKIMELRTRAEKLEHSERALDLSDEDLQMKKQEMFADQIRDALDHPETRLAIKSMIEATEPDMQIEANALIT